MRKACKKQCVDCGFKPSENVYEPLKLMQTVVAKANDVCLRYLDNSTLCSLPPPGPPCNATSTYCIKNTRRKMEDRHVIIHDLNSLFNIQEASPSSYFAVFDGHGGQEAAAYSAAHLHQFLAESDGFQTNPKQALRDAFRRTDEMFIEKCKLEHFNSGTTAVCVLLRPKEKVLYVAWAGDSQAILASREGFLQCVEPHKPSREDEKDRIEREGGLVLFCGTWRVNGWLAVSRAIGDSEHKPFVIATPDMKEIALNGSEDFLIIACDGLWDYLPEEVAARTVYTMVSNNPDDINSVSQRLVQSAVERGSSDNISVIVVFLREPSKIASAEAHWATRNGCATMDTASLDNANAPAAANNPFINSNGAPSPVVDVLHQQQQQNQSPTQKDVGFLLNLNEEYTHQNGGAKSHHGDFFSTEKSGNFLGAQFEEEDDDLGPETDVDTVDDVLLSPSIAAAKALAEGVANNNPLDDLNPFGIEKGDFDGEVSRKLEFDESRSPREETPTPPVDEVVHDGGALVVDTAAESADDSEDEWNYIKGDMSDKENVKPTSVTQEENSDMDMNSRLNPDAAEFVPISPTRIASPICGLLNDAVISQSPRRVVDVDIKVPNAREFEREIRSRPSEGYGGNNGVAVDEEEHLLANGTDVTEEPTNVAEESKNVAEESMKVVEESVKVVEESVNVAEELTNVVASDEFHFGPNAAPFTPAKLFDQSEAFSTRANFGDDTIANLDTSADEEVIREADPMSMSFYQDRGEENPFDLNKVQVLPDNLDEFLKSEGVGLDGTISDLPEHEPLEGVAPTSATPVTDLDEAVHAERTGDLLGVDELQKGDSDSSFEHVNFDQQFQAPNVDLLQELSQETKSDLQDLLTPDENVCRRPDSAPSESAPPIVESKSPELAHTTTDPSPLVSFPIEVKTPEPEQIPDSEPSQLVSFEPEPLKSPEPAAEVCLLQPQRVESLVPVAEDVRLSPELIERDLVSPDDEQPTSSVKDDDDDSPDRLQATFTNYAQEISNAIQESMQTEQEQEIIEVVSQSTPKSTVDTESVTTTDVHSFLERSNLPDMESPLSGNDSTNVTTDFKMEPELFPIEERLVSVSVPDESAAPKTKTPPPVEPEIVEPVQEVVVPEVKKTTATTTSAKKPSSGKKPLPTKTTSPAVRTATKTATKPPTTTATSKPSQPTKTASPRPTTATAATGAPKSTALKSTTTTLAKPRAPRSAPAAAEKKLSLTNGDVKAAAASKRVADGAKGAVKAAPRTTGVEVKARTVAAAAGTKTATNGPGKVAPVRVSLAARTTASSAAKAVAGSATAKTTTTRPATSTGSTMKTTTTTAAPAKPRPSTAPLKRVPLTRTTVVKSSPDMEKQMKDSLNKLAASRSATGPVKTTTTTVKKTETKTPFSRMTTTKTTTTTLKSMKKPETLVRKAKNAKPQQNGVAVVEEITIVTSTIEKEPQLVKDNSPLDNNILDSLQCVESNKAD